MPIKRIIFIWICLLCFVPHQGVWAALVGTATDRLNLSADRQSSEADKPAATIKIPIQSVEIENASSPSSLQLKMDTSYFVNAEKPAYGKLDHPSSMSRVGLQYLKGKGRLQTDIHWFYSYAEQKNYFDIPELSFHFQSSNSQLWIGRHLQEWSKADSHWQTGIWQPQMAWDGLNAKEQGLTGVFFNYNLSNGTLFKLFASGLFAPSMGPTIEERNGRLVSKNPWVAGTPAQVRYNGVLTRLNGHLDEPSLSEVVNRPSVAIALENKWENGVQTQIAYGFKPVNQAQILYEFYIYEFEDGTDYLDVTGRPEFPSEHIVTAETSWQYDSWQTDLSLTYQDPVLDKPRFRWISQDFPNSLMGALGLHKNWNAKNAPVNRSHVGVLKLWQEVPNDKGELAQEDTLFTNRARYNLALKVGHTWERSFKRKRKLKLDLSSVYDLDQEAAIFQSHIEWGIAEELTLTARGEFLGATNNKDNDYDSSFIRKFKANDNVGLGVRYVY